MKTPPKPRQSATEQPSQEALYSRLYSVKARLDTMKGHAKTLSEVRREIAVERETIINGKLKTWRKVGEAFPGVPPATLCAIYKHGREPVKSWVRESLGLPAHITIRVVPCPKHGVVHVTKRCPCQRKPGTKPRQWKRLATWAASMLVYIGGGK